MRLSPRLAALLALAAMPLLFVGYVPWLLVLVIVFNVGLAACAAADVLATPRPEDALDVERTTDEKLSLGRDNPVAVRVRNRSPFPLTVTVRDSPPVTFGMGAKEGPPGPPSVGGGNSTAGDSLTRPGGTGAKQQQQIGTSSPQTWGAGGAFPQITLSLPAGRAATWNYHVRPPAKGDFTWGDVWVSFPGRLGLIIRQAKLPLSKAVKVYPDLKEIEKYEMLARRGRLQQMGVRPARLRGGGAEFESLREYVPGDEYKKIDWSATARRGKLITRQYEVERSQNIVLLIDTGRTMLQPVGDTAKLDFVVNTALMLAYVAAASDDKVGLMSFDADISAFLPPVKGRAQAFGILESLYNLNARMVESDYKAAFLNLATRWRRRSLVVLFTDLIDPDSSAEILAAVPILEGLHRVVCVTVSDPHIVELSKAVPDAAAQVYEKAVATQVLQERRGAISLLKRRGVWTVDSPPADLSADLINHYLDVKARSLI